MAMELDHSFTVPVPPDQAWGVLLDVKRIAPCMPGATVDEVEGDVVTGRIKVKVGPVQLTYRGTAKFTERDQASRTVVVEASGKETRGSGTASATVRSTLEPAGDGTEVTMHTTMNVTGRPAQFGRGVMVEVGGKLVEQFAQNLAQLIAGDSAAETATGTAADAGGAAEAGEVVSGNGVNGASAGLHGANAGQVTAAASTTAAPPAQQGADSLNLVRLVGPSLLKRAIPVAVAAAGIALLSRRLWRRIHRAAKA
jgi:uncharacterized protein